MKMSLPFGFLFTVVTLTISLFTACGRSPLVRPETSASQTEIAAETGEAISPVLPATKPPETPMSTPSPTATVQTSLVSEADASPSPEPALTPTAKPLSPLDDQLQTIIFNTASDGAKIWRVQVNEQGQKVGEIEQVDFPSERMTIHGLYPSPDGHHVAVMWQYGDGAIASIDILDVVTGQRTPLLGEKPAVHPLVWFLAWSPDGQSVLVNGLSENPDLHDRIWLVNINTHAYRDTKIKQEESLYPYVTSASFSPDGIIAYAQEPCSDCGNQLWRINSDGSERQLLFEDPTHRITDVFWSPTGDLIAFTQWTIRRYNTENFFAGELGVIKPDGSDKQILTSIVIHPRNQPFCPTWSPNGQQLAFVKSENSKPDDTPLAELTSNIYTIDVASQQLRQATKFTNSQVIRPNWSPDSVQLSFLVKELAASSDQFKVQFASLKGQPPTQLNLSQSVMDASVALDTLDSGSSPVWLP